MADEKSKTVKFNNEGLDKLPNNKPAVYKILDSRNENIYTGSAKRGRLEDRLKEHLPGGKDPIKGGVKAYIQQQSSIAEAQKKEQNIIAKSKPRFNKLGK